MKRAKTCWLRIRITCLNGATCMIMYCCFWYHKSSFMYKFKHKYLIKTIYWWYLSMFFKFGSFEAVDCLNGHRQFFGYFRDLVCELYSIKHYVIKFVSHLTCDRLVVSPGSPVSSPIKHHHDITEILLKVTLKNINKQYLIVLFIYQGYNYYNYLIRDSYFS